MSGAVFRTPEERFDDLPDFPWEPRYVDWNGIRLARIDEGEGDSPIVLFHGEPTWSLLWRKVIPPLLEAGHRCIAPDLPGFGRSDKPTDFDWYSYDRHTEAIDVPARRARRRGRHVRRPRLGRADRDARGRGEPGACARASSSWTPACSAAGSG